MIRSVLVYIALVMIYGITWILAMVASMGFFDQQMAQEEPGSFDMMILMISALNAAVLYGYLRLVPERGWRMVFRLMASSFGLTFLITQIESLWFIDSLNMQPAMIYSLLAGGLVSSFLFSWVAVKMTPVTGAPQLHAKLNISRKTLIITCVFIFLVWPMIYFLAGYYIAWQSADIRIYYTSSTELRTFTDMMKTNFADGLYTFQVLRTVLWIILGLLILQPLHHRPKYVRILMTGALFAILGSSQLLLQNPIMPESVREIHLIETAISTFLWGCLLASVYSFTSVPAQVQTVSSE